MDSLNTNIGSGPTEIYALKKAQDIEARNVLQVLEGLDVLQKVDTSQATLSAPAAGPSLGAELTGLGQKLDISV
jgi:hypothetical protein